MHDLYNELIEKKIIIDGKISHGYRRPSNLKLKFPNLYKKIFDITNFLPVDAKIGERIYCIKNNIKYRILCPGCKKAVNFKDGKYFEYCSLKCSNNSQYVKIKKENTNIKNLGVKYASQSSVIQKKQKATFQRKYGVDYPFQNEKIQKKMQKKFIEDYGVDNPRKSESIKNKIKETKLKKYNCESYAQIHIPKYTLEKLNNKEWLYHQHIELEKPLVLIAKELNVTDVTVRNYLYLHGLETQKFYSSTGEKEILSFIQEHIPNDKILSNTRILIPPLEIDIYIPDYSIAIEYCGLYWHSEQAGKNRNYHKNKFDLCNNKNVRLLTIFEDEWLHKQNIVKNKIKNILNINNSKSIYARNTKIIKLFNYQKKEFFNEYHIQGNGKGSINYGLEFNNEIVACISFIKQEGNYTLNRYATSQKVAGGFSKLLKYFQKNHDWKKIITFADLRWSNGNLYEKTGWKLDKILPPDYYYIEYNTRVHKFNYRHKNLSKKLKNYDPSLSEKENCENNNILKIWNCGLKKYVINQ